MYSQDKQSRAFFQRALTVMPYGVSSNYRYYGDEDSPVVADAQGGHVFDFDGNEYVDFRLGWGPILLGHADPFVNGRVKEAIDSGVTFAATQRYEVSVAERIIDLCPGVEMVRLANTGSECTMHALRLARGYTGRDMILKFEGSYHGAHDNVLWSTIGAPVEAVGARQYPRAYRQSKGVPEVLRGLVQVCPWNDVDILGSILREKGHKIAAIIMEPMLGNANGIMPRPGFLEFVRQQCDEYGIILIFDEVKTGFRIAPGGARELFGVIPDISTYAKALGNGYPVAAFGGKRELMMHLAAGKVFQGGTYTGNVVSTAAADAVLERIQSGDVFARLEATGRSLIQGFKEIAGRLGAPLIINGTPAMFGVCFAATQPYDWRDLRTKCDLGLTQKVFAHMIQGGVWPEAAGTEPIYICTSHSPADVEKTLYLFEEGLRNASS